jgi:hypothetical protein
MVTDGLVKHRVCSAKILTHQRLFLLSGHFRQVLNYIIFFPPSCDLCHYCSLIHVPQLATFLSLQKQTITDEFSVSLPRVISPVMPVPYRQVIITPLFPPPPMNRFCLISFSKCKEGLNKTFSEFFVRQNFKCFVTAAV